MVYLQNRVEARLSAQDRLKKHLLVEVAKNVGLESAVADIMQQQQHQRHVSPYAMPAWVQKCLQGLPGALAVYLADKLGKRPHTVSQQLLSKCDVRFSVFQHAVIPESKAFRRRMCGESEIETLSSGGPVESTGGTVLVHAWKEFDDVRVEWRRVRLP